MSHFLPLGRAQRAAALGRPYAAVMVGVEDRGRVLRVVTGEIVIARADALVVDLPPDVRVIDPDGGPIRQSGRFLVTVETFDPYHLVLDCRDR
jgi:hypothetical protein